MTEPKPKRKTQNVPEAQRNTAALKVRLDHDVVESIRATAKASGRTISEVVAAGHEALLDLEARPK